MISRRSLAAVSLLVAVTAVTSVAGCSRPYTQKYRAHVTANRRNVQELRLGMSRSDVDALMGTGELVNYKRVQLTNPWRAEKMRVRNDLVVDVVYYVTEGYHWQGVSEEYSLTPLIFENDRLAGWGWAFLDSNKPRYVKPAMPPVQ